MKNNDSIFSGTFIIIYKRRQKRNRIHNILMMVRDSIIVKIGKRIGF